MHANAANALAWVSLDHPSLVRELRNDTLVYLLGLE